LTRKKKSDFQRLRRQRTVALTRNRRIDKVNHSSLNGFSKARIRAAVEQNSIQIQTGSPDRVIPGPRTLDAYSISHQLSRSFELCRNGLPSPPASHRRGHIFSIECVFEREFYRASARVTVATSRRAADAVMREILFVAVDPNQVLERTGDAGLFMRL